VRLLAKINRVSRWATKSRWHKLATTLVVLVFATGIALQLMPAGAATATLVPDTDVTTGWTVLGGSSDSTCAGGTHCDYVDEGTTAVTTDYFSTGTAGSTGETEEFTLGTTSIGLGATQIDLKFYAQSATNANGSTLDNIAIRTRMNGTLQTATNCTPAFNTWAYCTATYTGTYTQTDIDSLQAQVVRTRQGSGSPGAQDDDVRVANVYATVTYVPVPALTQASHRWFEDGNITDIGTTWTSRTAAAAISWTSVTYGNGLFVAVSNGGTGNRVMTSPDGITWTSRTSAADNSWTSVTYGNGLFVAVAGLIGGGTVMTSPDGITWTSRTASAANRWQSVTYGNGLFVAVSDTNAGTITNRVMTSPDGTTWTSRTAAADNNWYGVTYGNGLFVATSTTGTGDRVMTSPDGITWTSRTSAADNGWLSVTYGNGLFVAVSYSGTGDRVMTSPNGTTWTSRTSAANNTWNSVTYGNGLFVAVSETGTGDRVMTSPDGITWTSRTSAADNSWTSVTYGNGLFVSVALDGTNRVMTSGYEASVGSALATQDTAATATSEIARLRMNIGVSTDPLPASILNMKLQYAELAGGSCSNSETFIDVGVPYWAARTASVSKNWTDITYGNGLFVAVASSGTDSVMTSPDGINWTTQTSINRNWTAVTYGNGLFVAVAQSGTGTRVMTSPDGAAWTSRASAEDNTWRSVTYGNGVFVAVSSSGTNRVMTSPDGINWTPRTAAAANSWGSVTYGNGVFVAVAGSGTGNRVMTSPDGTTWTSRTSAADNVWTSITYGNSQFVAVSGGAGENTSRVMTSPDGTTWTLRTTAIDNWWASITYGNGQFVALSTTGSDDRAMASPDGINWSAGNAFSTQWEGIAYGDGIFAAVATTGIGGDVMSANTVSLEGTLDHNRASLVTNANDPTQGGSTIIGQSYQTLKTFTNDKSAIAASEFGRWDFPVDFTYAQPSTTYCLRAVKADNSLLDTYSFWPEITTASNNDVPVAPTLSVPTNSATGVATNPLLQLSATDSDGDYLRYKIEVCSTSDCSAIVRTIDQTASQTGWSGQNAQTSTAYTSGSTASHTYQTTFLSNSTQYWWRAYAIDPGGSNTFSEASSIYSFTTTAPPPTSDTYLQGGVQIHGGTNIGL
jgi:hypothetical protein